MPEISNISLEPTDPYDLGTMGMIHSSKFTDLIRIVLENDHNFMDQISELLHGHRLEGVLEGFEKDQLADFIRHVVMANKDKLDWEIVDDINYKLKKKYTPRWQLPGIEFDLGFRQIFITRVNWELSPQMVTVFNKFVKKYKQFTDRDIYFKEGFDIGKRNIWNFRDLFILLNELSYFVSEYKGIIDVDEYSSLINSIKQIFEESYKNRIYTVEQRISLILLYTIGVVKSSFVDFNRIQILLDNSFTLIKQLPDSNQKSYRLMFGYAYAIFSSFLFTSTSDLVVQRDLIAELLQDFYKPEEVDLDYWSRHLATSKPHPLVFSSIIEAYYLLLKMLKNYSKSLPDSSHQDEIIGIFNQLIDFLHDTTFQYLEEYYGISDDDVSTLVSKISEEIQFNNFRRILIDIITYTIKTRMLLSDDSAYTIDDYKHIVDYYYEKELALIYLTDFKIRKNVLDFVSTCEQIASEFEEKDSIILSTTFEDEVINVIGRMFSNVQKRFKERNEIDIEEYEIVLLFITNWIQNLYDYKEFRYEALMILSPLASICYIQLARGFFERNNLEAAYLSYFNSHYMVELINSILDTTEVDIKESTKQLVAKFSDIVDEWDISHLLDSDYIKRVSSNIEVKMTDRANKRADKSFSMGGMLQDEIVIGYLDLMTKLETFLQMVGQDKDISEIIETSNIYEPPSNSPEFRFSMMGFRHVESEEDYFPIPIIRRVQAYSMAIKLYPIDVNLPGSIMDITGIFEK